MNYKLKIDGSVLKLIAIISMTFDHFGCVIMPIFGQNNEVLYTFYQMFRYIGRLAFPIYCFLLIEGFKHTSDKFKYFFRLLIFAIISEVPFDLAFYNKLLEFENQNVFFTLSIGIGALIILDYLDNNLYMEFKKVLCILLDFMVIIMSFILVNIINSDYESCGIALIISLYILRNNRILQCVYGSFLLFIYGIFVFKFEVIAGLGFIPVYKYNGERGKQLKYFFYLYYPVHLFCLFLIRDFIKMF